MAEATATRRARAPADVPQTRGVGQAYPCPFTATVSGNAGYEETDTVTATLVDDEGNSVSDSDDATVTITDVTPTPADVVVVKEASPTSVPEPGGPVTFTVRVTNHAVEPLTLTALVDDVHGDLAGRGTCDVPQTLGVGQTYTCTFTATVSGNAGHVETDTVTATLVDDEGNEVQNEDSATVIVTDTAPSVSIVKTASAASLPEPGGTVTFTLTVTNNSVETVTITALSDTYALSAECLALVGQTLAPGASASCQYAIQVEDAGTYGNTASVTVEDDENNEASDQDTETVEVTDVPPIPEDVVVTKTADPESLPEPGGVVTFTVQVTNQAVEPLTLTALVDDVHGDLDGRGTCDVPQTLGVGQTYTCYFTATVSGNAGYVETDTVTATLVDDEGNSVSQSDTATVAVAGIRLDKATNRPIAHSGDLVTYTYTVTNPGVTALSIHRMADDRCDSVAFADGDADGDGWLDPDETWVYTCQQVIWDDTTNTAVVEGVDTGGAVVSARDSAFVDVITPTIDVSISAPVTTTAGVLLPYTILFTNTSDPTLVNPLAPAPPAPPVSTPSPTAVLVVSSQMTC